MYLLNQTFFVFGLSKSGNASTEFLLERGARVYIYDETPNERIEKTAHRLVENGATWVKQEEVESICELCDVLVLSPGVPIDHPDRKRVV